MQANESEVGTWQRTPRGRPEATPAAPQYQVEAGWDKVQLLSQACPYFLMLGENFLGTERS